MPRPRFAKLSETKRERIMEAAAKEFAAQGYDAASLNTILENAEISKGAAYYYFDDKADLFLTVVQHYSPYLTADFELAIDGLTTETFWPSVRQLYIQQFARVYDCPWIFGAVRAAARVSKESRLHATLDAYVSEIMGFMRLLFKKGQALGVVRRDLPDGLMYSLIIAFDGASDQWLLDHWDALELAEMEAIASKMIDAMQRMLSPPE